MITAGIDMGSRSIKVVLLEELKVDGAPQLKYGVKKAHIMMPGDLDQDVAADKAYNEALAKPPASSARTSRWCSPPAPDASRWPSPPRASPK
jgi:hypothetical protein